jgi:hypothetical protein
MFNNNNNNNNNKLPKFIIRLSNTKPFKHVHVTGAPKAGAAGLKTPQIEIKKHRFCRHNVMACYTRFTIHPKLTNEIGCFSTL